MWKKKYIYLYILVRANIIDIHVCPGRPEDMYIWSVRDGGMNIIYIPRPFLYKNLISFKLWHRFKVCEKLIFWTCPFLLTKCHWRNDGRVGNKQLRYRTDTRWILQKAKVKKRNGWHHLRIRIKDSPLKEVPRSGEDFN